MAQAVKWRVDDVNPRLMVAGLVVTAPAANWLIGNVGTVCLENGPCLVPVGFGLMAPSGVVLIGVGLALRDTVHERMGANWAIAAIVAGASMSFLTAPAALAVASSAAFILAELADFAVYTPLRKRGKWLAVLLSGAAGAVVDSALFSALAFGAVTFAPGLIIGKLYASAAYSSWLAWRRT